MRSLCASLILLCAAAHSTQIIYMDLDEVIASAGTILVVEIASREFEEGDGWVTGSYTLGVIDAIRGWADSGAKVECFYRLNLPRRFESASGPVTWVSPWETGSGMEFLVSPGDTVIALFGSSRVAGRGTQALVRMEPLSSRGLIETMLELEEGTSTAGQVVESNYVETGGAYAQRFRWVAGKWKPSIPVSTPSGSPIEWEWENAGDWQSVLLDTTGTLLIAYEVLGVEDIMHLGMFIEGMSGRFVNRIVCRILDAFRWEIPPELTR